MLNGNTHQETDEPEDICSYIRNLSDDDLDEVVLFPILAQDLLEHAAHCQECGDRIEAMDRKQFAHLPREEQAAYEDMARTFILRNFGSEQSRASIITRSSSSTSHVSEGLDLLRKRFIERSAPLNWEFERLGVLKRFIDLEQGSFEQRMALGVVLGSPTVEYQLDLSGLLDELGLVDGFCELKLAIQTGNKTRAAAVLTPREPSTVAPEEYALGLELQLVDAEGLLLSPRKISLRLGAMVKSPPVQVEGLDDPLSFAGGVIIRLRQMPPARNAGDE